ncbi:MAG: cupin domain-containing protein [Clostridia bacterium]|nr:cupin domain-containing protein [Clostridia bacterium]
MKKFNKVSVGEEARTELHDALNLTGAEISVNTLPAGTGVPFVHSHKQNEEIYAILSGKGTAVIDGETISLKAGEWLRISPSAKRQFFASENSAFKYLCIQVKENSLEGYTMTDAIV